MDVGFCQMFFLYLLIWSCDFSSLACWCNRLQLTPEQPGFKLPGSTCTQIFFNKYVVGPSYLWVLHLRQIEDLIQPCVVDGFHRCKPVDTEGWLWDLRNQGFLCQWRSWDQYLMDPKERLYSDWFLNVEPAVNIWDVLCAQSCPTLPNPTDRSPPVSTVHEILQGKNTGGVSRINPTKSWYNSIILHRHCWC